MAVLRDRCKRAGLLAAAKKYSCRTLGGIHGDAIRTNRPSKDNHRFGLQTLTAKLVFAPTEKARIGARLRLLMVALGIPETLQSSAGLSTVSL